jgi:hypothetical protein
MLQIIVWLGCVYLAVKGFEMVRSGLTSGENPAARAVAFLGAALAFVAVPVFFVMAQQQVQATNPFGSPAAYQTPLSPEAQNVIDAGDRAAAALEATADNLEAVADAAARTEK